MMKAWVAFAATGDPNGSGLAHWPAYDPRKDNFLAFGDRVADGHDWRGEQLDFLDGFFETAARQ